MPCIDGVEGAQGVFEPIVCKAGYYCPESTVMQLCPKGYYCPTGTFEPIKCDFISICNPGSKVQLSLVGITFTMVLDLILITMYIARYIYENLRKQRLIVGNPSGNEQTQFAEVYVKNSGNRNSQVDFKIQNLQYDLKLSLFNNTTKRIVNGINGHIKASKMTAIIGPSGAGKTTFLNLLSGKLRPSNGTISSLADNYKDLIAFVPQNDVMFEELTVRENILHSARIRLDKSWSWARIDNFVDLIINILNLENCQHTIIGDTVNRGISGGERKRVNIGMELSACPACLFLDEPTSGLDSSSALIVVDILRKLSENGMTVVACLHQPRIEIYKMFDECLMVGSGGHCVYLGPGQEAKPYFEKQFGFAFKEQVNEADVFMDILCGHGITREKGESYSVVQMADFWRSYCNDTNDRAKIDNDVATIVKIDQQNESNSKLNSRMQFFVQSPTRKGASFLTQLVLTHNLNILQQYRRFTTLLFEAFVGCAAGALMGISIMNAGEIYRGILKAPYIAVSSAPLITLPVQFMMILGAAVALAASPSGVAVFSEETFVYWRYASSGHDKLAYYAGKTIATTYRIVFASLHFSAVLHLISRPIVSFATTFLVISLMFFGVYGLCCAVSMVVRRENATLLAVVLALFSAVFCGYVNDLINHRVLQSPMQSDGICIGCGKCNLICGQAKLIIPKALLLMHMFTRTDLPIFTLDSRLEEQA